MKTARQRAILELLRTKNIATQDELTAALKAAGFSVAQATISRDIRELRLRKEPGKSGALRYVAPGESFGVNALERVFRDGLVSVDYAGNMLVLRTLSGLASGVAAALDGMDFPEILGTVAGDDVVICVVRSEEKAAALLEKLQ